MTAPQRTYKDLAESALRLIGITSQGQKPRGNDINDTFAVLNEEIDSWNAYPGLLYSITTKEIPLNGSDSYIITPRPTALISAYVRSTRNIDSPLKILENSDYALVPDKSAFGTMPHSIYLEVGDTSSVLHLHPSSATTGTAIITYRSTLAEVTPTTPETLPPAYRKALRYNLACALAVEYGKPLDQEIKSTAIATKSVIIQNNTSVPEMKFNYGRANFNINTGR